MRGLPRWLRRTAPLTVAAVAAGASAAITADAAAEEPATAREPAPVVRKSAAEMTRGEIDRFRRAFSYAVRKGYFDVFSAEHFDRMRSTAWTCSRARPRR